MVVSFYPTGLSSGYVAFFQSQNESIRWMSTLPRFFAVLKRLSGTRRPTRCVSGASGRRTGTGRCADCLPMVKKCLALFGGLAPLSAKDELRRRHLGKAVSLHLGRIFHSIERAVRPLVPLAINAFAPAAAPLVPGLQRGPSEDAPDSLLDFAPDPAG